MRNEISFLLPCFFSIVYISKLVRTVNLLNYKNIMYHSCNKLEKWFSTSRRKMVGMDGG